MNQIPSTPTQVYLSQDTPYPSSIWESLYPKTSYTNKTPYGLHYLLALNFKEEVILKYIKAKPIDADVLQKQDPKHYHLTPLHIAAMMANKVAVEAILSKLSNPGKHINEKDAYGFTSLHHAALTSNSIYDLLLKNQGDLSLTTLSCATALDLKTLSLRISGIRSSQTLYFKGQLLSQLKTFEKALNFIHTDSPHVPDILFDELWQSDHPSETDFISITAPSLYDTFCSSPPKLNIIPCKELTGISEHFYGVEAFEDIDAGKIISEYAGLMIQEPNSIKFEEEFNPQFQEKIEYQGQNYDAKKIGNESRFFNSGFPNCIFLSLFHHGIDRVVFLSLRKIKKGEPILWSYGPGMSYLVLGTQVILGKKEMEAFYKKGEETISKKLISLNLKSYLHNLKGTCDMNFYLKLTYFDEVFVFPFDNPTALLYLHFNKIVSYKLWEDHLYSYKYFLLLKENDPVHFQVRVMILDLLKEVGNDEQITAWVLDHLEKIPLMNILKGIQLFIDGKNPQNFDFKNYNWLQDPEHPLSKANRHLHNQKMNTDQI